LPNDNIRLIKSDSEQRPTSNLSSDDWKSTIGSSCYVTHAVNLVYSKFDDENDNGDTVTRFLFARPRRGLTGNSGTDSDCRSNGSPRIDSIIQSKQKFAETHGVLLHGARILFRSLIFALNQAKGKKRSRPSHHLVEFTTYAERMCGPRGRYFEICDVSRRHTHWYSECRLFWDFMYDKRDNTYNFAF